jgi:hypothetical protein
MSAPAAAGASPGAAGTHNYQFDIHSPAGGYADPNDVLAQAEQQFRARGGRLAR